MTSMTRLPTVWPARPVSHPVITCDGDAPMTKPNGEPDDQEEAKIFLLRQMQPAYCAMTNWPLTSVGPLPLISVLLTSAEGGLFDGIAIAGALPVWGVIVGRLPPPLDSRVPKADAVLE